VAGIPLLIMVLSENRDYRAMEKRTKVLVISPASRPSRI
jgi:hypothetical protein